MGVVGARDVLFVLLKCAIYVQTIDLQYTIQPKVPTTTTTKRNTTKNTHAPHPQNNPPTPIIQESWREKLGDWSEALQSYTATYQETPLGSRAHTEAALGRMRCLAALAEWEDLFSSCRHAWSYVEPHVKREIAPMGAAAAWQMGQWGEMEVYVSALRQGEGGAMSSNANFLSAVMAVRNGQYAHAQGMGCVLGCVDWACCLWGVLYVCVYVHRRTNIIHLM